MTDIYVSFPTFKRLIKKAHQSGPIFESKETVLTTVGALTVVATKPAPQKVFTKTNGFEEKSFPFTRRGYMAIATNKEKMLDDDEVIEALTEEFGDLSTEALERMLEAIRKLLEKR